MLLAIDAGNSHIKFALFDVNEVRFRAAVPTSSQLADLSFLPPDLSDDVDAVVIGSVVPSITPALASLATHRFGVDAYVVETAKVTGIEVDYQPAGSLGVDRLADAVAAAHFAGTPSIAVDMGTATTFNVVVERQARPVWKRFQPSSPKFAGGVIAPGVGVLSETLASRAAQLEAVSMSRPPSVLAKNTHQALQSGLFYGYASIIDNMVERLQFELGIRGCAVIATGGGATAELVGECRFVTKIEPNLTLHGLRLIYERRGD